MFWAYIQPHTCEENGRQTFLWVSTFISRSHSTSGVAFEQVLDLQVFAWPVLTLLWPLWYNIHYFTFSIWFIDRLSCFLSHFIYIPSFIIYDLLFFYLSKLVIFSSSCDFLRFPFCLIRWHCTFLLLFNWNLLGNVKGPWCSRCGLSLVPSTQMRVVFLS